LGDQESVVSLRITDTERRQYADDGFFVRQNVFGAEDLDRFRAAAERVVQAATRTSLEEVAPSVAGKASGVSELDYQIDGNRYVETGDATVQFEHHADSETIRVIEPFHHLDPVFDLSSRTHGS